MDQEAQARRSGPTRTPGLQCKKRDILCERASFLHHCPLFLEFLSGRSLALSCGAAARVTIQLALNQVHPAADLVMDSLHVLQQV